MKLTKLLLVGAIILAAVAMSLNTGKAQVATQPAALVAKVAVCDMNEVFEKYQKKSDLLSQLVQRAKTLQDEDKAKVEQLQKLDKALESIAPGSKEMDARLDELQKLSIERKVWQQLQEERLNRERRMLLDAMFKEIMAAVDAVAKERGYDIVLARDTGDVAAPTDAEMKANIRLRKCLYSSSVFDLTVAVLERVNRQYTSTTRPK